MDARGPGGRIIQGIHTDQQGLLSKAKQSHSLSDQLQYASMEFGHRTVEMWVESDRISIFSLFISLVYLSGFYLVYRCHPEAQLKYCRSGVENR